MLLYLIQLTDKLGIDLTAAAERKLEINRQKYPDAARGTSRKYTELECDENENRSERLVIAYQASKQQFLNDSFKHDIEAIDSMRARAAISVQARSNLGATPRSR